MQVEISYELSAGKNAENKYRGRNRYLEKIKGIDKAVEITKTKMLKIDKQKLKKPDIEIQKKEIKNKDWFEKFKWFYTTNNFLVIAGRDAKNNEQLVKKHFSENDLYFHADIHGAPHTVLLNPEKKEISEIDKEEAANFAAIHSSAWKSQTFSIDVYSVGYGQVSKTAGTGESLGTGAFVIRGKRDYYKKIDLTLGIYFDNKRQKIIASPISVLKNQKEITQLLPGSIKKSEVCKIITEKLKKKGINVSVDDLMSLLPPGDCEIKN
ncbi:MAG TPA: NFACT RNA binding domain-containing protein [archaeon]|nr:NFACT RNA binding domain-containing protein [archaeon]